MVDFYEEEMEYAFCPLCGLNKAVYCKQVQDSKSFLPGTWPLKKCKNCCTYFLSSPPNQNEMAHYYTSNYFTHSSPTIKDSQLISTIYEYYYGYNKSLLSAFVFKALKNNVNLFPQKGKLKPLLLDVGCGNGKLMLRFEKYGFICSGFDVDPICVEGAKDLGLNVFSGDFLSINFKDKFDVVILNQALEHFHDPLNYLKKIYSLLNDDGQLIISVPNSSCLDFHILKDSWSSFQAPTHIYHFSKKSLTHLLIRSGFSIRKFTYSSSINTVKPKYLSNNIRNLFAIEKNIFVGLCKSFLFIFSSFFSVLPFLSCLKRIRVTVYCEKGA